LLFLGRAHGNLPSGGRGRFRMLQFSRTGQ
jgi:hypothetical protein